MKKSNKKTPLANPVSNINKLSDEIEIKYETSLGKFNQSKFNRDINLRQVKKLVSSIESNGYFFFLPIFVNENLEILDGHHRFIAIKEINERLKTEIKFSYIVINSGGGEADVKRIIKALNTMQRKWTGNEVAHRLTSNNSVVKKMIALEKQYNKPIFKKLYINNYIDTTSLALALNLDKNKIAEDDYSVDAETIKNIESFYGLCFNVMKTLQSKPFNKRPFLNGLGNFVRFKSDQDLVSSLQDKFEKKDINKVKKVVKTFVK